MARLQLAGSPITFVSSGVAPAACSIPVDPGKVAVLARSVARLAGAIAPVELAIPFETHTVPPARELVAGVGPGVTFSARRVSPVGGVVPVGSWVLFVGSIGPGLDGIGHWTLDSMLARGSTGGRRPRHRPTSSARPSIDRAGQTPSAFPSGP